MKISVIMMSYLDEYPNARTNSIPKFKRAVNSFLEQDYENKELVIVADGCDITKSLYEKHFSKYDNVNLIWVEKSKSRWPGKIRQLGIYYSTGDYIAYLDADDVIMPTHLSSISKAITESNGAKFLLNTGGSVPIIIDEPYKFEKTGIIEITSSFKLDMQTIENNAKAGKIYIVDLPLYGKLMLYKLTFEDPSGTHLVVHSRNVNSKWSSIDDPMGGEDKVFIEELKKEYKPYMFKEYTYIVCHSKMKNHDV
jgi:glycosyltransferase involved in cell wall biosynthesis